MPLHRNFLFLFLIILIPAGLYAQAGESSAPPETTADTSDAESLPPEGLTVSIDLRTGLNAIGIIPGIPVVIGVPISLSSDSVALSPEFGFLYCFDVMTDLHNSFYIPLGLNARYNPWGVGIDLLYYPPVGGSNTNHMFSAAVSAEAQLFTAGNFALLLELKFGQTLIFDPAGTAANIMLNLAVVPRYKL